MQSDYGWHIIRKVSEVTTDTPLADCPEEVVSSASETIISDAYYRFIEDLVARRTSSTLTPRLRLRPTTRSPSRWIL